MKIALINASPKVGESASRRLIAELKTILETKQQELIICELHKPQIKEAEKEELFACDAIVFAFPLYVDGIPSHLLYCLKELQEYINAKESKPMRVYAIVNCGFYEGKQNAIAIDMMKHWTARAGLLWGQGIGVGAGGMISSLENVSLGVGPMKNMGKVFHELATNITEGKSADTRLFSPNFPRFAYKFFAHMGWKKQAKQNGLVAKALNRQL